ncbi:hypothetical protein UT300012_40360 [Paraclostridium bifermentans]|uniref:hypothetical protein n=1 Tax=Paraclostridium bifermentans TaxID=1490 RepID=UPI00241E8ED6|nr:hypothetical protein [Paraclostridium bifermentans]
MSKLTVLEVNFGYTGGVEIINPVILSDEKDMILIDCGYPNFLSLNRRICMQK